MLRVARFLRGYVRHPVPGIVEEEVAIGGIQGETPATLLRPVGESRLPGWIVLHGVTVPGRRHPVLTRFARALASTGGAVLIPEVTAWRELRLDASAGDAAILAAVDYFRQRPDVGNGLNLVGFSFGATQALMSAVKPGIREHVRGIVAFGGYCDLGRTLHCMLTGEHEWMGVRRRLEPDPYGRWIIVGNYLRRIPEFAHMRELASAALGLAAESGRRGIYAADPRYDRLKVEYRDRLPTDQQEIWDIIAPVAGVDPCAVRTRELADLLVRSAVEHAPALDPRPSLPLLDQRIVLAHGYDDRLIPFTETLRLRAAMPETADVSASITRFFAHSRAAERVRMRDYPAELGRYLALLNRALRSR